MPGCCCKSTNGWVFWIHLAYTAKLVGTAPRQAILTGQVSIETLSFTCRVLPYFLSWIFVALSFRWFSCYSLSSVQGEKSWDLCLNSQREPNWWSFPEKTKVWKEERHTREEASSIVCLWPAAVRVGEGFFCSFSLYVFNNICSSCIFKYLEIWSKKILKKIWSKFPLFKAQDMMFFSECFVIAFCYW